MQANGAIFNPGDLLKHRYRVVKLLGQGSFGQTLAVEDLEDRGERKVLKVLLNHYPKAIELFQREAEVLQHLDCPGIPKVEREGYFTLQPEGMSQPLHCLVMEYVRGQNLEEWLEQNQPISQDQALDWLKQLVEILGLLHDRDYFHRDIKPGNIMRQPDGQLALIDFGAVREVSETYLVKMSGQYRGTAIGSPGYWAPEQADGQGVPESDFFALSRTFVYLLTGQHPLNFTKDPNNGRLIWRGGAPQVSADLAGVIDEMMAPFPGQRPQLTQVMLRLEAIEMGWPIISPLVDRARVRLEAQKRETGSAEAQKRETGSESRATTNRKRVTRNYEPEASHAQLRTDRPVKGKVKLKIAAVVGLLSLGLVGGLGLASPQMVMSLNKQGVKHHRAKELVRAEFYYRFALLLRPDYAKARYNLGVMYDNRNDRDRAMEELEKSMQGGVAPGYNKLALLHIRDKNCDAALPLLQEGFALADSDAKKYPLLVNLGRAMLCQNRYSEARDYLQKAIALYSERSAAHCLMPPVLDGLGDRQAALLELEQCPTDAPNNPPELNDWLRQRTREGLQVAQDIEQDIELHLTAIY